MPKKSTKKVMVEYAADDLWNNIKYDQLISKDATIECPGIPTCVLKLFLVVEEGQRIGITKFCYNQQFRIFTSAILLSLLPL